ncbi:hypothetical protein J2X85_002067 [Microbacterium trichothecenolyticum]|uniref:hypothetical protein n=1 Tax=Microbacterium trichothecenolyticum TaxID=69370 RepID=UPI00285A6A01|nr:hypothetical protein [Microbacterium trichothecenolyticum]MDR7185033.1 hypothetical protein [Microbacterium trichothecenolyticum]
MTVSNTSSRTAGVGARVRAILALDGPVAGTALTVFQYFVVSVSFLACLGPALAFAALVGWQPTHLAIWLGAASLLPLVPATYALLRSTRRLLAERGEARAGRLFWRSFASGCRHLAWAAIAASAVVLLLAYDFALFGGSDAMLLFVAASGAASLAFFIAVSLAAEAKDEHAAVALATAAAKVIARHPHIVLSWLLLTGLGVAALALPVVGPPLALFLPALLGVGIHICNDALRLPLIDETRHTP